MADTAGQIESVLMELRGMCSQGLTAQHQQEINEAIIGAQMLQADNKKLKGQIKKMKDAVLAGKEPDV